MFNLPNLLALSRLLIAPVMFWVILNPQVFTNNGWHISWSYYTASLLFVLASVTDFFDGYIARELDQITIVGQILDPLADKMLTLAAFLGLMMSGEASAWAIYIIIGRELFITSLRTLSISIGIDVSASLMGKIKTVIQMIAIGFLLMHWAGGDLLLWMAVAVTIYSGGEYLMAFANAYQKKGNQ
ncbi:MAG: CDP-diacylglycerol---glycerol-3-phosphate 3-phosphatidyltransferase [Campylobacterota bacterium]|nr:CDP-diacylglycerol---glycerol-3-phosphate 3-phosphatidyltransferase [Campylobacterota bacterium]